MKGLTLILSFLLATGAAMAQNSIDGTWVVTGHETDNNIGDESVD